MAQIGSFIDRPKTVQVVGDPDAAVTATLAANSGSAHALSGIHVTYSAGGPSAETLTIAYTQDGAATSVDYDLTVTGGVTSIVALDDRIVGDRNTVMTVTASALAGATITLEVFYH